MYFNEKKEDTNIDKEFDDDKKIDLGKFKKPLIIIIGIILLIIIIMIIISSLKNKIKYFVNLEGNQEMTIYQGASFNEPGYEGYDNKGNNYDVTVKGEVDTSKLGTYEITYSLHNITKTRTVKVIEAPSNPTILHLNGDKNITLNVGEEYKEPGYNAVDYIDGDISSKVTVSGTVDTKKAGIYRLVYSVVNSKNVTTSETRVVTVK